MKRLIFLVVGAGFSGAVIARELVEPLDAGVLVLDSCPQIGGNCHTERDAPTGITHFDCVIQLLEKAGIIRWCISPHSNLVFLDAGEFEGEKNIQTALALSQ